MLTLEDFLYKVITRDNELRRQGLTPLAISLDIETWDFIAEKVFDSYTALLGYNCIPAYWELPDGFGFVV